MWKKIRNGINHYILCCKQEIPLALQQYNQKQVANLVSSGEIQFLLFLNEALSILNIKWLFEMGNQNVLFVTCMKCWLRFLWWLNSLWSKSFSALAESDTSIFCQDFSPCKKYQSINVQEIFRQISQDNLWIFLRSKLDEKWDLYINITMVMLIQSTGVKLFQLITTISKVEKFGWRRGGES